jgi:hypothetical protein
MLLPILKKLKKVELHVLGGRVFQEAKPVAGS